MTRHRLRLTLDLDPEMHHRLKIEAANRGISMRQLCLIAFREELSQGAGSLTWKTDPLLAELWDNEDDAIYDNL